MTNSQRMAGQLAAMKLRLNAGGADKLDDAAHAALLKEHDALEVKRLAAVVEEQRLADDAFAAGNHESAESREMRALVESFDAGDVLRHVGNHGHTPTGQTAELQQHHGRGANFIPPEILNPEGGRSVDPSDPEQRAAATFTADTEPGTARGITGEAIGPSLIQFLGGRIENVAAGAAVFPVISTGASISYPAGSAAAAQTTGAFTVHKLEPKRAEGQFALRREDLATYPGQRIGLKRSEPTEQGAGRPGVSGTPAGV